MQNLDTNAVQEQLRRRQRVARMKSMIVGVLSGWVLLSMILIVILFVLLIHTKEKLDQVVINELAVMDELERLQQSQIDTTEAVEESMIPLYSQLENYEPAIPAASGISEEENIADESDIHKVYLTFEDGPSDNTEAILDVLKDKGVKATFFVTGKEDEASQALYKRIVEEGHTLGMHSYSNKYSELYYSEDNFKQDLAKLRGYLLGVTGTEPIYYRFPGGSNNQITNVPMENLIHYLNQEGLIYYDWNITSGDTTASAYTKDEIVANVTGDVVKYKTAVVLLHDAEGLGITAEGLEALIDALLEMDAEILPIDEDTSVIQYVKADDVQ